MLFNSLEFAIFLPVVFVLYWFVFQKNIKAQNLFILVVSYIFYGWWDWRFLSLLAFSSFIDYFVAHTLGTTDNQRKRKYLLWLSLVTNLGLLGVFKYFNFFSNSLADAFNSIGIEIDPFTLQVVLPVGISFYTFQTLSYTIDVYRKDLEPAKDIVSFFAYVSFFPQLVAGPIERATNLLPQFYEKRTFSYAQSVQGLRLILWGLFKKIVIADNCAEVVNKVFSDYSSYSGLELVIGVFFFAFQIYGDFSGYSDIARGCSKLFGFELMVNFKLPYFSRDIAEFWRRWHISLSTWFRDYLYVPLGGSRQGKEKAIRNTFIIFLVSGFWHGANWTFLIWGLLHSIFFLPLLLKGKNRVHLSHVAETRFLPTFKEGLSMLWTFLLVCVAWIFFRSSSVTDAFNFIGAIFTNSFLPQNLNLIKLSVLGMIFILIVIEWVSREDGVEFYMERISANKFVRHAFYYFIIFSIWFFGAFNNSEFIYFQF